MDKVKEKVPASGGAETSTSEININKSITPIGGNVKGGRGYWRSDIMLYFQRCNGGVNICLNSFKSEKF